MEIPVLIHEEDVHDHAEPVPGGVQLVLVEGALAHIVPEALFLRAEGEVAVQADDGVQQGAQGHAVHLRAAQEVPGGGSRAHLGGIADDHVGHPVVALVLHAPGGDLHGDRAVFIGRVGKGFLVRARLDNGKIDRELVIRPVGKIQAVQGRGPPGGSAQEGQDDRQTQRREPFTSRVPHALNTLPSSYSVSDILA